MRLQNQTSSADWNQFRRLMVYLKPHLGRLSVAMLAIVIGSVLSLAGPYTLQYLIDAVFTQNNAELLNRITLVLIAIFALQAVFYFIRAYQLQFIGERVMIDLRLNLFRHLQKLSLSFYNERRTGELVSRATNDVATVRALVTSDVSTAISQVITFFGALILILVTNWQLTLFMLTLVPLVVVIALLFGRRLRKISGAVQDQLAEATTVLEEAIGGVRVVQSFTREDYEIGRYGSSIERTFQLALKRIRISATFGPIASFMGFGAVIAVFWFGGQQVLNGTLTAGQLTMFLILTLTIAGSIGQFSGLWTSLQEALGATKRIFEIIDTPSDIVERPDAPPLPRIEGHLTLDRVSFAYKDNTDQHVLRGVSLEVKPGEVLALVGPSGAGKTTLVNLIPRFFDPQTGGVCIDGQDIRSVQVKSLREQIGLVPQDTLLFGGTVRENILYGKLDATEDELMAAARAANAHDFITQLSKGYETIVGERGVKLSGGQRQRIAIARAILKDPRILLLDEATSSLDSESEGLVQEALERLMQGRTSVVIAHRLSTVHHANRIAVLDHGELVELGTHAELIAHDGLYARLYKMQFRDNGAVASEPVVEEIAEAKPKPRSRSLLPGLIG
ncbi:Putative multidrug export ATP-binding/permease protein [Thermoflexales bacterium]|nr:Putative multidrug export ATP-binding/permease protein [Thermoflexales bacterium]